MPSKKSVGQVISNKMQKTVVVKVENIKVHERYGKRYKSSTSFSAHNADFELSAGDLVEIVETKPISKTKKWLVTKLIQKAK